MIKKLIALYLAWRRTEVVRRCPVCGKQGSVKDLKLGAQCGGGWEPFLPPPGPPHKLATMRRVRI